MLTEAVIRKGKKQCLLYFQNIIELSSHFFCLVQFASLEDRYIQSLTKHQILKYSCGSSNKMLPIPGRGGFTWWHKMCS